MTIQECRDKIDRIDEKLVGLLRARLAVSEEIAKIKERQGLPTYNKAREELLLSRIGLLAEEDGDEILPVFTEILRSSRARQDKMRKDRTDG